MKQAKLLILLLGGILFMTWSCNKPAATVLPTVAGNWDGYYSGYSATGFDTTYTSLSYGFSMICNSAGIANVFDQSFADTATAQKATGVWTLTGNIFRVDYTYHPANVAYYAIGTIDTNKTNIFGKWYAASGSLGGEFYFVKK